MPELSEEGGFGVVELVIAVIVIGIALLALMASYDEAFLSVHDSARTTAAADLAEQQLETVSADSYCNLALVPADLTAADSSDPFYQDDWNSLSPAGTDVTSTCLGADGTYEPVQTSVQGSDDKDYRVELFIRDVTQNLVPSGTTTERVVTVIVRDPNQTGTPIVFTDSAAFDQGPRS